MRLIVDIALSHMHHDGFRFRDRLLIERIGTFNISCHFVVANLGIGMGRVLSLCLPIVGKLPVHAANHIVGLHIETKRVVDTGIVTTFQQFARRLVDIELAAQVNDIRTHAIGISLHFAKSVYMSHQTHAATQMMNAWCDPSPQEIIVMVAMHRREIGRVYPFIIEVNMADVLAFNNDVDIMMVDGSRAVVEGTKCDLINLQLNRRNPHHGRVTNQIARLFHLITISRLIQIDHTGFRGLKITRAIPPREVKDMRLAFV